MNATCAKDVDDVGDSDEESFAVNDKIVVCETGIDILKDE